MPGGYPPPAGEDSGAWFAEEKSQRRQAESALAAYLREVQAGHYDAALKLLGMEKAARDVRDQYVSYLAKPASHPIIQAVTLAVSFDRGWSRVVAALVG